MQKELHNIQIWAQRKAKILRPFWGIFCTAQLGSLLTCFQQLSSKQVLGFKKVEFLYFGVIQIYKTKMTIFLDFVKFTKIKYELVNL